MNKLGICVEYKLFYGCSKTMRQYHMVQDIYLKCKSEDHNVLQKWEIRRWRRRWRRCGDGEKKCSNYSNFYIKKLRDNATIWQWCIWSHDHPRTDTCWTMIQAIHLNTISKCLLVACSLACCHKQHAFASSKWFVSFFSLYFLRSKATCFVYMYTLAHPVLLLASGFRMTSMLKRKTKCLLT